VRILIRSHEPMTIDELLRTYVDALRDFLSLAADRPDQLTCCSLELPVSDTEGERLWPIDVVFSPASNSDDKGALADFLFTFADVRVRLGTLWSGWIALRERLRLPIVLFFGTVYAPFLYPETRLVQFVQALENLDRRLHRGMPADPDFIAWRERVAEQLSTEDSGRFLRELDIRKGATLRQRLERMLAESVLREAVVADAKAFARLVADTRHYWTHGSETQFVEHDPSRLYWSGVVLQYLFKEELLATLGFEPQARRKMVRSSRRFQAIPTGLF
jgi:ApeA N-terminal domain 1